MNFNSSSPENNYKFKEIYRKVGLVLLTSIICILLNFVALLAVFKTKKTFSYFLVNLFLASLTTQFIVMLTLLDGLDLIELRGEKLCGFLSAFKRVGSAILPLTVMGLSYEKLKTTGLLSGNFSFWKVFLMTWGTALIISFPSYFAYEYVVPDSGGKSYCRKKPLLDSLFVKIAYELLICAFLHLFPSTYILYYLFKLKFRIEYLKVRKTFPTPLKKKLSRIRMVFWYSISFIGIWLPLGIVNTIKLTMEDPRKKVVYKLSSPIQFVILFVSMSFLVLHPTIYLWAHNDLGVADFIKLFSCFKSELSRSPNSNHRCSTTAMRLETIGGLSLEYSRVRELKF